MKSLGETESTSIEDLGRAIRCGDFCGLGVDTAPIGFGLGIGAAPAISTSGVGACCEAPSSCAHFNMSLANIETGENLFAVDPEDDRYDCGVSELAYQFIGGILGHAKPISAVAPTPPPPTE